MESKQIAEIITAQDNKDRVAREKIRYNVYHGKLRDYIEKAIYSEFKRKGTVEQLVNRIVPLNITQKIINRLAKVYLTQPQRSPMTELPSDEESLDLLNPALELSTNMLDANRYFKLSKHFCLEPYAHKGAPRLRVLAAHNYTPISDDVIDSAYPTHIVKHLKWGENAKADVHVVWSDDEHYVMNGLGDKISMPENPEGKNPYGINPLIYVRSQKDALLPIEDDDLLYMQTAICLLLTDMNFASKFKLWNLIYVIGIKSQAIDFNPNQILFLPKDKDGESPEVGTIESKFDSDGMLRQVQGLVSMLLSTKQLKAQEMQAVTIENAASGIAKMLDTAESTEDKVEQQNYFVEAEKKLFEVLKKQLPVWDEQGLLEGKFKTLRLSDDFILQIRFPMPKAIQSEKDTVETEKAKLESGFTTKDRSLAVVNSDLTPQELEELKIQIEKESKLKERSKLDKPNSGGVSGEEIDLEV